MYNNLYGYNPQLAQNRIDEEISKLQQLKGQVSQQPSINQTFQLAPQGGIRYANSIEDVEKEIVYGDTPYFSNDLSLVWLKNAKGNIKAFELKEIVEKDEKDLLIDSLQLQINDLRKEIENARTINTDVNEPSEDEKPPIVSSYRTSKKK